RIANAEGKPIRGVRVGVEMISVFSNNSLDYFLAAWKKDNLDRDIIKQIWSGADAIFATTTAADGRFVLHGLGVERTATLRLNGGGIADTSVRVVNRPAFDPKPYNQAYLKKNKNVISNWLWWVLSGPEVSVVAQAGKTIQGLVSDAETGKGQPNLTVRLTGNSDEGSLEFGLKTKTDAQGRYEIPGVRKASRYELGVVGDDVTGYVTSQVMADDTAGY